MQAVYDAAEATGLFAVNDIKVRLRPYQYFKLGKGKRDFIHIFGYIMEGRFHQRAFRSGLDLSWHRRIGRAEPVPFRARLQAGDESHPAAVPDRAPRRARQASAE